MIVNQIAYTVVVTPRLQRPGQRRWREAPGATGYTVYSYAFLIVMVPHSIITVSLATAILPRLSDQAADGDQAGLARTAGDDAAHRARGDRAVRAAAARSSPATPPTSSGGTARAATATRTSRPRSRSSVSGWCSSPSTT